MNGIEPRHARGCTSRTGSKCNCDQTYRAWVYDKKGEGNA